MKKLTWFFLSILVFDFSGVFAGASHGFKWKNSNLNISCLAPPALINVANSQNQETGADFSVVPNSNGTQGNGTDSGLAQIPLSRVWQQNDSAFDGANYENRPDTLWNIDIYDSGSETLTLNVMGITTGMAQIKIAGLFHGKGNKPIGITINVLVSQGLHRQITLSFNPGQKTILTQPIITNSGLLSDVQTACQLGQISPHACSFLTDETKLIQDALDKHHNQEAKDLVLVFLHSLNYSRPFGCKDVDYHAEVKEPALTILKTDALALLAQIEKAEK